MVSQQQKETVGIASIGYYIPENILTSSEMSRLSGIPLPVFLEKIGMEKKHIAARDEQPSDMGIHAARKAVKRAGIDPGEIVNEINHFDRVQFGKTVSRSVLGSMNDIAWQYQVRAEAARDKTDLSLSEAEASLSQMPCKPIGYKVPAEVAKELLEPKRKNVS